MTFCHHCGDPPIAYQWLINKYVNNNLSVLSQIIQEKHTIKN